MTSLKITTPQAIVAGAALTAFVLFSFNAVPVAQAQRMGPYQLMQHSNTTANVGVFRIDTSSGEVSYCYLVDGGAKSAQLTCTAPVR